MQRLQDERNSKFWRWQNFITTLLLAWMFLASLAGGFYVSDVVVNGSLQKVSMYKLKKIFLFPAWTSLTLVFNILLGYVGICTKKRVFISIKLGLDMLNILFRGGMIYLLGWIYLSAYGDCAWRGPKKLENEPDKVSYSSWFCFDDKTFRVPCYSDTINRVRLEYGLIIVILAVEILSLVTLLVSCVVYCTKDCFCCMTEISNKTEEEEDELICVHVQNVSSDSERSLSSLNASSSSEKSSNTDVGLLDEWHWNEANE